MRIFRRARLGFPAVRAVRRAGRARQGGLGHSSRLLCQGPLPPALLHIPHSLGAEERGTDQPTTNRPAHTQDQSGLIQPTNIKFVTFTNLMQLRYNAHSLRSALHA